MAIAVPSPVERGLEFAAAAVPAVAGAYAGTTLGPLYGFAAFPVAGVAASVIYATSLLFMRTIGKAEPKFAILDFAPRKNPNAPALSELLLDEPIDVDELLLDSDAELPLVLDRPFFVDQVDDQVDELAELLLNDSIPPPPSYSRVVQLFATQPMPTAGQLADRIERHLGHVPVARQIDATDALHEALDELRRSLRRA